MSGIFGIFNQDKRPINPAHLEKMAISIRHRGPDGTKTIIHDDIGFGHSMLQTTQESLHEQLPYVDIQNELSISSDARLDNREELGKSLDLKNISDIPDSQLILLAYQKWDVESFLHLIGDFAFVIWDKRKQQLICARDYIGIKPFFYHHSASQFVFSSEITQLAEQPGVPLTVNEAIVAEYLTFSIYSKTETFFKNIQKLSPGHYLKVTRNDLTTHQYWSFLPVKRLYYKNSSQYTEHFLEIFKEAVGSRLRSNKRLSAELSGGLDSSSVVGMACKLLDAQNLPRPVTYGMIFPGHHFDERQYIESVSKKFDLPVHYVESQHFEALNGLGQTQNKYELPYMPNLSMKNALMRMISKNDSRVLLSGLGGDEWFTGSGYPYLDLLKNSEYSRFIKQLRHSFSYNKRFTLRRLAINLLWQITPGFARNAICRSLKISYPPWVSEKFIIKTGLSKRIQKADPRKSLSNLGNLSLYKVVATGEESFFLEAMDRYHASYGIEYRSPFLDRRIAEFAFSMPDYERMQMGKIKTLLRSKNNSLLPEIIRSRHDKAEFSFFFGKAFSCKEFTEVIKTMRISKQEWINSNAFHKEFAKKQNRLQNYKYQRGNLNAETWLAYAIEVLYRKTLTKRATKKT